MKKIIALGIAAVMTACVAAPAFAGGKFEGKQTASARIDQGGKEVSVTVDLSDGWSVEFASGALYLYDGPAYPEKEADVIALTLDQEVYDEYIQDAENHEDARTEDGITAYSEEDGTKDYFFEVGDGSGAFFMISVVNQDEDADAAMSRIAVEATGWTGGDEEVQAS